MELIILRGKMYWMIAVVSLFASVPLTSSQYTCSDCNTVTILARGQKVASIRCSGAKTYCRSSTGTCSDQPDKGCEKEQKEAFNCSEDGYFPDFDCKTYFVCKNKKGTKFNCPYGKFYNADKHLCEADEKCATFDCSNSKDKTPHPVHSQYYADCPLTGRSPSIYKCPDGHKWSEETKACEAHCDDEGLIVDTENCLKYFRCEIDYTDEGKIYRRVHESCPKGQGFDALNGICVQLPSDHLPNCFNDNVVERNKQRHKRSLDNSDLFCLEDSAFPAENCYEYYTCVNNDPTLKSCDNKDEIFNPVKAKCHKGLQCGQYNCTTKEIGRKVPHSVFPSYYAYCGPDLQPLVLGHCQGKFELDYTKQVCANVCRSVGLKPDPFDCLKYYRCRRDTSNETSSVYISELHSCPDGTAFDPVRLHCSENHDACSKTNNI